MAISDWDIKPSIIPFVKVSDSDFANTLGGTVLFVDQQVAGVPVFTNATLSGDAIPNDVKVTMTWYSMGANQNDFYIALRWSNTSLEGYLLGMEASATANAYVRPRIWKVGDPTPGTFTDIGTYPDAIVYNNGAGSPGTAGDKVAITFEASISGTSLSLAVKEGVTTHTTATATDSKWTSGRVGMYKKTSTSTSRILIDDNFLIEQA